MEHLEQYAPIRVVHIYGAEPRSGEGFTLSKLLSHMDRERFEPVILDLSDQGLRYEFNPPVKLHRLPIDRDDKTAIRRNTEAVARILREENPAIVHAWATTGNYYAAKAVHLSRPIPLDTKLILNVTNPRTCEETPGTEGELLEKLQASYLARFPVRYVYVSEPTREAYRSMRFPTRGQPVLYNGVDTDHFSLTPPVPDIRAQLGIPQNVPVIGMAARFDYQKDPQGFIGAAAALHRANPQARFILCGTGMAPGNKQLMGWLRDAGVDSVFHLLGEQKQMECIYHAADIWTCCSQHEAFGNVVVEAMACGKPCVVTDAVGAKSFVKDIGEIIPVRDIASRDTAWADMLSKCWQRMLQRPEAEKQKIAEAGRERVTSQCGLRQMVTQYEALYDDVLSVNHSKAVAAAR